MHVRWLGDPSMLPLGAHCAAIEDRRRPIARRSAADEAAIARRFAAHWRVRDTHNKLRLNTLPSYLALLFSVLWCSERQPGFLWSLAPVVKARFKPVGCLMCMRA